VYQAIQVQQGSLRLPDVLIGYQAVGSTGPHPPDPRAVVLSSNPCASTAGLNLKEDSHWLNFFSMLPLSENREEKLGCLQSLSSREPTQADLAFSLKNMCSSFKMPSERVRPVRKRNGSVQSSLDALQALNQLDHVASVCA
jgi:hypothetical protein